MTTRRDFIKKTVAGTAALSLGSILPGFGSSRYQDILGANEKIRIGVIGVNSRGKALAQGFAKLPDCEVTYICDVVFAVCEIPTIVFLSLWNVC